ncbi:GNAT family N-acetyltransferase [Anaerobacillus sp. MEB173]|uniref:GNAT family N-acetyltransferase n=1 Tax=Anaerobacillus sp. MEB173 TaxID=3383345 RepID=UPI003F938F99
MKVYKVPNDADQSLRLKIADLMMGQMESIGADNAYELLIASIDLTLKDNSLAHMFVVEDEEVIVGVAFFNIGISLEKGGYYMWLNDLYVHKEHRNQGIAKRLLLQVIHWAETENIKVIETETGINNLATKSLYNSLGFYDIISKRYGFTFS